MVVPTAAAAAAAGDSPSSDIVTCHLTQVYFHTCSTLPRHSGAAHIWVQNDQCGPQASASLPHLSVLHTHLQGLSSPTLQSVRTPILVAHPLSLLLLLDFDSKKDTLF